MSKDSKKDRRDVIKNFYSMEDGQPAKHIARARKFHEKLKRYLHRLPEVIASDVGFLVQESARQFLPLVGIRIHVKEKYNHTALLHKGLKDLAGSDLCKLLEKMGRGKVFLLPKKDEGADLYCGSEEWGRYWKQKKALTEEKNKNDYVDNLEGSRIYVVPNSEEDEYPIPIDLVSVRYFPSGEGVQTSLPLPNSQIFENDLIRQLGRHPVDPLVGGVSIGNSRGSSGTLGAIVWDTLNGRPCILGNWHVLSPGPGDQVGQPCYQPGLADGGRIDRDRVGSLRRWIFNRHGDAALASLDGNRHYCAGEILGLWHPVVEAVTPKLGMEVRKWGRSSGFTEGFIDGVDLCLNVEYAEVGLRYFEDQVHIAPLAHNEEVSMPGDSGAIWVTKVYGSLSRTLPITLGDAEIPVQLGGRRNLNDRRFKNPNGKKPSDKRLYFYMPVGLHFAGDVPGSPLGEHAVASPLTTLAKELQFSFRPVFPDPEYIVAQPAKTEGNTTPPPPRQDRGPAQQIDTGYEPYGVGGQPDTDPLIGHP